MDPTGRLYSALKAQGLDFFVSVPCKLLNNLILTLEKDPGIIYTPVTREEEGVGVLAGAFLAGKRPAIVMQNSGIGNSINAICSLLNYYGIPLVFVISHRGTEGEKMEVQRNMGAATQNLLAAVDVRCYEVPRTDDLDVIERGVGEGYALNKPVAFLFPFSFWEGEKAQ